MDHLVKQAKAADKAARAAHTRYLEAEANAINNLEDEAATALFEEACCEDEQATTWAESCERMARQEVHQGLAASSDDAENGNMSSDPEDNYTTDPRAKER
ncbi:hypothetical protein K3495_g3618 [Podosphaera aphanis]|nr:hypothetical protein K3495_g3618 [Podosphaera aphanis]